jgi:hypothetical protein
MGVLVPYKNKEDRDAYIKEYRIKNKAEMAKWQKEYREKNKERLIVYEKERYVRRKESRAIYIKKWSTENKDKVNAISARRRAAKLNATPAWADKEAIDRMYTVSNFLTNKLGEPHHVDHVIPLQGKNICGLHVEYNLDVIPAVDNLSKGNKIVL